MNGSRPAHCHYLRLDSMIELWLEIQLTFPSAPMSYHSWLFVCSIDCTTWSHIFICFVVGGGFALTVQRYLILIILNFISSIDHTVWYRALFGPGYSCVPFTIAKVCVRDMELVSVTVVSDVIRMPVSRHPLKGLLLRDGNMNIHYLLCVLTQKASS